MISSEEAHNIVMSHTVTLPVETVEFRQTGGRVLMEDIYADRDFPPYNRIAMDGVAINLTSWERGQREFPVAGVQTAGEPRKSLKNPDHCVEVMTGAMLPLNTDTVIRYEDLQISNGIAQVKVQNLKRFQHIHLKGADRKQGEVLIKSQQVLTPAEIAILATVGRSSVKVLRKLRIAVVATGDELVEISEIPEPYQIRKSNQYALQAAVSALGQSVKSYHLPDDEAGLRSQLSGILKDHDMIIMSGGVSKGKKDYVPVVLEALHVHKYFHGVKQRPGKPFWFGKHTPSGTAVFALPGNPVSAFMCFYRYVKPWISASSGINKAPRTSLLADNFNFEADLTYFLQVKIQEKEGVSWAVPVKGKGSGDLANLLEADAFMELPAGSTAFSKGEVFPIYLYR